MAKRKHVPVRTCVVCRSSDDKRQLTRIVKMPDGKPSLDPSGKAAGRGAYVCNNDACWNALNEPRMLAKALRVAVSPAQLATLQRQRAEQLK